MLSILPTDTCYGLAGELTEQDYREIYRLKGRDFSKQLAILVESFDDMRDYIEISDEQIEFLRDYPYPWSFLGNKRSDFVLPTWMDSEKYQMLSIRVAKVCIPQGSMIARIDDRQSITDNRYPMFLTSANLSGHPESKTLVEAQSCFPGIDGLDGWVRDSPPSDIFSIDPDGELQYLRRNY